MKILFVVPSLGGGGAERVVTRLSSAMCDEHEVHIALTSSKYEPQSDYAQDPRVIMHDVLPKLTSQADAVKQAVPTEAKRYLKRIVNRLSRRFRPKPAPRKPQGADRLAALKRELGIDVSISFLKGSNYLNVLSASGEATIVSVRNIMHSGYALDDRMNDYDLMRIKQASLLADAVVAVSHNVGVEQVVSYGIDPAKIVTIYNLVDADDLREKTKAEADDPEFEHFRNEHDHVILAVGRHVYQKGFWHLIRALKRTREQLPQAGLVILGKGPMEDELKRVIKANGLGEHVYLAGYRNPFPYLARCDVFCLSSLFEGFSNALLEAMACGLPLVATDCNSGPRELMLPDADSSVQASGIERTPYGLLVPRLSGDIILDDRALDRQERFLADALAQILTDEGYRANCREACARRIKDFATDVIVAQWMELVERVHQEKHASR